MSDKEHLDLFLLKRGVVVLHEVLQALPKYSAQCDCPLCGKNIKLKARKKSAKLKGRVCVCTSCSHSFVVPDYESIANQILDAIVMFGDAGVPLPPKRGIRGKEGKKDG